LRRALAEVAGTVLPRASIMDALYGNSISVTDRALDAYITRLRRKFDADATGVSLSQSVRGEGYVLATEVDTA